MPETLATAPFTYFGGKRRAAPIVWGLLGDPAGYVEPFAGSAAVLLARPAHIGHRVETLNDADGWLVNTWRAIRLSPERVATHAGGPVTEIDYHARLAWLHHRRTDDLVSWLEGDPERHDARAAGWWLYVMACAIGDPWDLGPWRVANGRLAKTPRRSGISRELPHLGDAGRGIARQSVRENLVAYMHALADRLARVRITCGDWSRVVTSSAIRAGAGGDGSRALFFDPPYATSGDLYAHGDDTGALSADVRDWCASADPSLRIVLAGYDREHDDLLAHGWRVVHGKSGRGAGYSADPLNGRRERLWASPACRTDDLGLFAPLDGSVAS